MVFLLSAFLLVCVVAMFGASWIATLLTRDTVLHGTRLVSADTTDIVRTAIASETVPLAFASLLDITTLMQIHQLKISHLQVTNCTDGCSSPQLPAHYVMSVTSITPINESLLYLYGALPPFLHQNVHMCPPDCLNALNPSLHGQVPGIRW